MGMIVRVTVRMVTGVVVRMIVAVPMVVVVMIMGMVVIVIMRVLVRMRMCVCCLGGMAFGGQNVDFCGINATAVNAVETEANAEVERIDCFLKNGNGNACVDERGEEHITADTGEAIEIGNLHRVVSDTFEAGSELFQPIVEAGRRLFMEPLRKPSRSSVMNL